MQVCKRRIFSTNESSRRGLHVSKTSPLLALACAIALLSGCTSSSDVLEPSALLEPQSPADNAPQFPLTGQAEQPAVQDAALVASARVQFAPVIGASADASQPLATRLSAGAPTRGLTFVPAAGSGATHVVKGYFSAISDKGETTVIYVWDVLDPSGTRVHRIQGQAKTPARDSEGWASVQPATMEAIADQTLDQLVSWLSIRQG